MAEESKSFPLGPGEEEFRVRAWLDRLRGPFYRGELRGDEEELAAAHFSVGGRFRGRTVEEIMEARARRNGWGPILDADPADEVA